MTSYDHTLAEPVPFNELYIFGAGGSGREVAWLAEQRFGNAIKLTFVVDQPSYLAPPVNGIKVVLLDELTRTANARFVVALGNPADRERIARLFLDAGHLPATITHPRAEMSSLIKIGAGSVVCANSILTTNVTIGEHVQINLACTISHDVVIGDYTTLSPAVNVCGNVHIGRRVFIGANACFINGDANKPLLIGDDAVIAAGACVTRDVDAGVMVAGVPAVRRR